MTHEKDIVFGNARVCWGFAWHPHIAGWCLPGGMRTNDRARAEKVCKDMNEIMKGTL